MKESLIIKFLYKTVLGRMLLKGLVNPSVSRKMARFLSSDLSRFLVPGFIKKNDINMSYYEMPKEGYQSFNDFFTRKMREEYIEKSDSELVCPCDGLLTVSEITRESVFHIKHTNYSVEELLNSKELAEEYSGGAAFIFRLTPAHYHRYSWAADGKLTGRKRISGVLHSVQPICHEKLKVFIQNSRELSIIKNSGLGDVIQMEVGALLVGQISNFNKLIGENVKAGQEKGFFEYGGSSIVVLTKVKAELAENIKEREKSGDEIPVVIGEKLIERDGRISKENINISTEEFEVSSSDEVIDKIQE